VLKLAIQAAQKAEAFSPPLKGDATSTIAAAI
jgi:hypothetical protein